METPRIQYARTDDGVRIACCELGSGPPVVVLSSGLPFGHLELEWQIPGLWDWCRGLAGNSRVIRMDTRGSGLSGHNIDAYTLEGLILDIEAVAAKFGLETFAIVGQWWSGAVALAYAARHPEQVSALALWHAVTRASDITPQIVRDTGETLIQNAWPFFADTVGRMSVGPAEPEVAGRVAAVIRESTSPDLALVMWRGTFEIDVTGILPEITAPTLVFHRRAFHGTDIDISANLTACLPNARMAVFDGSSVLPFVGESEAALRELADFVGAAEPDGAPRATDFVIAPSSFRTILFTDLSDHTAMMQRLGDAKGRAVLREHERLTRETLAAHGGTEVKALGDGFMASFGSAQRALECAIALQQRFGNEGPLAGIEAVRLHVGVNAGEPIEEDDDLFGSSVILASRAASRARAGEILVTDVVRQLVAGKGFAFRDAGEFELKGFEEPVRLYEVRWQGASA